jgi:hypothetical protein
MARRAICAIGYYEFAYPLRGDSPGWSAIQWTAQTDTASVHQGDQVLVEGTLVSISYEREYGRGEKATTVKHTVWQIRADSIRKLNRREKEPEASASGSDDPTKSQHRRHRMRHSDLDVSIGPRLCAEALLDGGLF